MENKRNKRDFKKGICLDSSRRKREETSIKLRKESKIEGIAKRRNTAGPHTDAFTPNENEDGCVPKFLHDLLATDVEAQTAALRGVRRLLSAEVNPPVAKCIEMGIVPILVQYLHESKPTEQQFEAAWALTNIASTDRTSVVVENGAVPKLVQLLLSPSAEIREQCAWCLGNIAGDGSHLRDYILNQNALQPLLLNITQAPSISILRNCTWTLSNFCRGKPQPELEKIFEAVPILAQLIINEYDLETMVDAAWAFSYLSDGDDKRIQVVIDHGLVAPLIKMISSGDSNTIIPALRTLGNLVSGNDKQTQAVLDAGALLPLSNLLVHPKKSIRKEACWVLSNIAAGTPEQLNSLYSVPELIAKILQQLSCSVEWDVRKEAAWVICNMITSSKPQRLLHLIELGVLQPLCDLLNVGDAKIILIVLDALEMLLKITSQAAHANLNCVTLIEDVGGLEALEKLQEHENIKVYERAVQILEKYFNVEEENENENLQPEVGPNGFAFGLGTNKSLTHNKLADVSPFDSNAYQRAQFNF